MQAYKYHCCNSTSSSSNQLPVPVPVAGRIKSGYHRLVMWRSKRRNRTLSCRWRMLWRKLKKHNKRVFDFSTTGPCASPVVGYDPYTYSQNFDHGSISDDPDNISRSFSARFALPTPFH